MTQMDKCKKGHQVLACSSVRWRRQACGPQQSTPPATVGVVSTMEAILEEEVGSDCNLQADVKQIAGHVCEQVAVVS